MQITIRVATVSDIASLVKIEQACFSVPWSENSFRESLQNPHSRFYLAWADGAPVGYMGVQIFSGEGYVTNIAVLEARRRQGVASALLEAALQNEMDFLTLEVRESNEAAIALYEKFGFEAVGKRPRFYREPTEDALLMTKYLKD